MSAVKWHQDRFTAFDTETTGVDPTEARIVTAAVVHRVPGARPISMRWLIDPGVEIPAEAAAVHGFDNDRVHQLLAQHGAKPGAALRILDGATTAIPAEAAVYEITNQLAGVVAREQALVIQNAPYDLTLVEHETARHGLESLTARTGGVRGVVDPMVIEKAFDPYRKSCYKKAGDGTVCDQENRVHVCGGCRGGKWKCSGPNGGGCGSTDRTLTSLCAHYGVVLTGAHDAAADAIACVRVLFKLIEAWPQIAGWKLSTLHQHQIAWRAEQQASLRSFFEKVGKDHDGMCPAWPLHTSACASAHREQVAA